ncbi:acyl carrier protein [Pseudomonadota bacterium]
MAVFDDVKHILADVLQLGDDVEEFSVSTPLLGSIPELDSMTVVSLITSLEEYYGFVIEDDEISAEVFESVGSLVSFIEGKV